VKESINSQQVEYDTTPNDVMAFYEDAVRRSPITRRQVRHATIFGTLLAVCLTILYFTLLPAGFAPDVVLIAPVILVVLVAVLTPGAVRKSQMRHIRRMLKDEDQRKRLGPTRIRLQPEGVITTSPIGTSVLDWSAFSEITTTSDYVFLQLDSLSAIIVPRRAFNTEAGFEDFVAAARSFKESAAHEQ
jgi:hypothetical protein